MSLYFGLSDCVPPTSPLYAPRWGSADSRSVPSPPAPRHVHRGCRGTSSPGADPLYGAGLGKFRTPGTGALMGKAGGDLKPRRKASYEQMGRTWQERVFDLHVGALKCRSKCMQSTKQSLRLYLCLFDYIDIENWIVSPNLPEAHGQWDAARL